MHAGLLVGQSQQVDGAAFKHFVHSFECINNNLNKSLGYIRIIPT